eukprot:scaffold64618_cov54-Phaeocystis_antarctica.AAC.9
MASKIQGTWPRLGRGPNFGLCASAWRVCSAPAGPSPERWSMRRGFLVHSASADWWPRRGFGLALA